MNARNFLTSVLAAALLSPLATHAEVNAVRVTRGFGISFLPLMIMEDSHLIEKHAKAAGLDDVKVSWPLLGAVSAVNDALISGNLDFAVGGPTSLIMLWSRTNGAIRGVCAMTSIPMYLNTRNPAIKSIKDFSPKDRIAVPGAKVSVQAMVLQMAVANEYGDSQYGKLDDITVTMSHPDALAALSGGMSEVNSHFTVPPFHQKEMKLPGVHNVLTSFDVLGGPSTLNMVWTTSKFRENNPKIYASFLAAFEEAIQSVQADPEAAARTYLKISKDKAPLEDILEMLKDPQMQFTMQPMNVMKLAHFMAKRGQIKTPPVDWKELFFPEAYPRGGS